MKRFWLRGPGLGGKLFLLSCSLLILPWFSFRQLIEMEGLLVQGQARAQLLTAEGISTLLNGRADLLDDFPVAVEDYERLYVHPLPDPIRIDGSAADWSALNDQARSFGAGAAAGATGRAAGDVVVGEGSFGLLLGERGGFLYGLVDVSDSHHVYRNNLLRLDNSDHLRLKFRDATNNEQRITLALPGPGSVTAYHADANWRFADGAPEKRVQAAAQERRGGIVVEFRLPLEMLGARRLFGISYVNVNDARRRDIVSVTQSLPNVDDLGVHLVLLRSHEVLRIIEGLAYSGARILVLDTNKQVRAEAGSYSRHLRPTLSLPATTVIDRWLVPLLPYVRSVLDALPIDYHGHATSATSAAERAIASSLAGKPVSLRRELKGRQEIIMAAYPIITGKKIIGTVILEQNTDEIVALQRQALERVMAMSVLSLVVVMLALLAFSMRLAWRIRSLRKETNNAIDSEGRLTTSTLSAQMATTDEIGDLARSVSNMLSKLHQHTRFLENIPRTLRHELNNPLNTLSTSLHNLEQEHPAVSDSRYLQSARRGMLRIGGIVQHLADAASLEESLKEEERERLDLVALVRNYVANSRTVHPKCQFVLHGTAQPAFALVADYRIEQMLDKIIDNAVDFHRPGTPIHVHINTLRDAIELRIENSGPPVPAELLASLFDSMISQRGSRSDGVHFGLGLFVVRVIAQHHGGSVTAINLPSGDGVAIVVKLPRVDVTTTRSRLLGLVGTPTTSAR